MPCKKRPSPKNADKKKVAAKARQPEKAVTIVKHFERKIAYNNERAGCPKIPEVNANIDRIENLKERRWPPRDRSAVKTHISPRPQGTDTSKSSAANKGKQQLKSKSYDERRFTKSCSIPPAKSKSLDSPAVKQFPFKRFKSVVKHSSTSSESEHANELKREILTHRSEPETLVSTRRDRVYNIRKELKELVGISVDEKRTHVAELMTEIAAFRKNDVTVYDVHKTYPDEVHGRTPSPKKPRTGTSFKGSSGSSSEAEPYRPLTPSKKSERSRTTASPFNTGDSSSDESISRKIEKANMLIRRVTQTLKEIKSKKKQQHVSREDPEESVPSDTTTSESTAAVAAEDSPGADRPKTRRREEPHESPEKFRTSPVEAKDDGDEEGEFELLQAKLNTIIENSEPEESSKSDATRRSDPVGVPVTVSCSTNTDRHPLTDRPAQTSPTREPFHYYSFENAITQTCNDVHTCPAFIETSDKSQQFDHLASHLVKSENLSVQLLPEISIPRRLQVERPLSLYIDEDGETHLLKQSSKPNVGYFEVCVQSEDRQARHSVTPTVVRVKGALVEDGKADPQTRPRTSLFTSGHEEDMSMLTLRSFPMENPTLGAEDETQRKASEANFSQFPRPGRRARLSIDRSYSDSELNSDNLIYSRTAILKAYQVETGLDSHDPGDLDLPASNMLLNTIDPEFFQNYINPDGLVVLKSQHSILNTKSKSGAASTRTKLADKQASLNERVQTDSTFGLFASKEVQCNMSAESSSSDDRYEKYSFSISYSTDSSDERPQPQPQEQEQERPSTPRRSTLNQDNIKKLKMIRDKIAKEHPEATEELSPKQSLIQQRQEDGQEEVEEDKDMETYSVGVSEEHKSEPVVKDFICGLISYETEELEKIVPLIRGIVQSKSKRSTGSTASTATKTDKDKNFTVNFLTPLYNHMGDVVSPLMVSRNGRYEDEKDLFCRNNSPRGDCDRVKSDKYKFIPRWSGILDSSFSSTITSTDKSLSEGEVTGKRSVSIGEVHPCTRTFSGTFQKNCKNGKIQKKRTYFSNWVTYYINKDGFALNDSTSSSNK